MRQAAWHEFYEVLKMPFTALPPLKKKEGRAAWVDVAKGTSICLVVVWHAIGDAVKLNEALIFLRMPLFFFAAGLFARANFSANGSNRVFLKIVNFMWLFLVWSIILFVLIIVPQLINQGGGYSAAFLDLALLFFEPPLTIWFIYALAVSFLFVFLVKDVPISVILLITIVAFIISSGDGNWRSVFFWERILRLLPFFILGLIAIRPLDVVVERFNALGPLLISIFGALAYLVYFSSIVYSGTLVFLVSLFGVFSTMLLSGFLARFQIGTILARVGSDSLVIYLMHKIFLFLFDVCLSLIDFDYRSFGSFTFILFELMFIVLSIVLSMLAGAYLRRIGLSGYLLQFPIGKRQEA